MFPFQDFQFRSALLKNCSVGGSRGTIYLSIGLLTHWHQYWCRQRTCRRRASCIAADRDHKRWCRHHYHLICHHNFLEIEILAPSCLLLQTQIEEQEKSVLLEHKSKSEETEIVWMMLCWFIHYRVTIIYPASIQDLFKSIYCAAFIIGLVSESLLIGVSEPFILYFPISLDILLLVVML